MNCSYFPDDYDDTKEKQDYEPQDDYIRYFISKRNLSQFFIDLLEVFPEKMSNNFRLYFDYINITSPIDGDNCDVELNGSSVEFRYVFNDLYDDGYEQLKSACEQAINEWINTFYSKDTLHRLTDCLSTNICMFYDNVINNIERTKYDDFMRTLANCLDLTVDDFMDDIIDSCEQSDGSNLWTDTTYKLGETEDAIKAYLWNTYTIEELWMACIYTRQYTNFEPDNA